MIGNARANAKPARTHKKPADFEEAGRFCEEIYQRQVRRASGQ